MPSDAPLMRVWNQSGALILSKQMPLVDKSIQVGLFAYRLFLGELFSVGAYTVDMFYTVGSKAGVENHSFIIIPGGHAQGCALGMAYYHRPHADFIVYQAESGYILKGKNPRIQ